MKRVLITLGVIASLILLTVVSKTCSVVDEVTSTENIITSYEEYENMYSSCEKICDDIKVLRGVSSEDYSKDTGFSKSDRLIALETNLNRWIREYNAKSRQITKNLWKSKALPHQLEREDFNCK